MILNLNLLIYTFLFWDAGIFQNVYFHKYNNILEKNGSFSVFPRVLAQILIWYPSSCTLLSSQYLHVKFASQLIYSNLIFHQLFKCSGNNLVNHFFYPIWFLRVRAVGEWLILNIFPSLFRYLKPLKHLSIQCSNYYKLLSTPS